VKEFVRSADISEVIGEREVAQVRHKFAGLTRELDERSRRIWAGTEATALGRGGIAAVARATGLATRTIRVGIRELKDGASEQPGTPRRVRRPGAGRKLLTHRDPGLRAALEALVESTTRGDPMSPLRWTCKSTRVLAEELTRQGHAVSHVSVGELLHQMGYSLQSERKVTEGTLHPDRDAQFAYINAQVQAFQQRGQPVISVDTKKKELVGDFKNGGQEWHPSGDPVKVRVHDFEDEELGKAVPYGVYDVTQNNGWVSVGIDHDTSEFAVASIRHWWRQMGAPTYPNARELLITADSGGSNGSRVRLWKIALQKLADATGLRVSVSHFPPGTSKWNKIEHRMFCHITKNWRGRPLESLDVIVNLIANTTTRKGLRVQAGLDTAAYPKGIKISDDQLAQVRLERAAFHGDWNYTILPASRCPNP
jgi:transposase